jgi:hypothetical protein
MRSHTRAGATLLSVVALALTVTVEACGHDEREPAPPSGPKLGATSGNADYNGAIIQAEFVTDVEPQPLGYIDATLADGAVTDGGWYSSGARYAKAILLDCGSNTKGTVYVDFAGSAGKAGQVNQPLPLATNIWHATLISKVYQVGLTGGCTVYLGY